MKHLAIIMDGNGRWANARNKPRVWGHIRGAGIVADIVEKSDELGFSHLTLYALSQENLSRPTTELRVLFKLLEKFIKVERERILKNDIRFKVLGDYSFVSSKLQDLIISLETETKSNKGLCLNFAFGHGGRQSILNCVEHFQNSDQSLSLDKLKEYFNTEAPDVDLLIRTGGDKRVSNYLLWQLAYAELCFIDQAWPDFSAERLETIVASYCDTERRFGGLGQWKSVDQANQFAKENEQQLREENKR